MRAEAAALLLGVLGGCAPAPVPPRAPPVGAMPIERMAAPAAATESTPPVYRNPRIGVVTLRAHEDAQGRLLGPQVMYEIVDPGGWNVEAAEGEDGPDRAAKPAAAASPLLDPAAAAAIGITGLMRLEDRTEAEARAAEKGGGYSAVFDAEAGWLLVPRRRLAE